MAVDSNVLIYERMREEVRSGRSAISSLDAGFARALATIVDSNTTTFIAAAMLFSSASGPVRGFALTLGIGIITTVFTAFTLTRLIVAYWVRWWRPQRCSDLTWQRHALSCSVAAYLPDDTKFDFMRFRRFSFPSRLLLSILAIRPISSSACNFGIDFVGGTVIEVQSKQGQAESRLMRTTLTALELGDVQLQQFGAPTDVLIRVRAAAGRRRSAAGRDRQSPGRARRHVEYRRIEVVGPRVSQRAVDQRHDRPAWRDRRHLDLSLVPLRVAVRDSAP